MISFAKVEMKILLQSRTTLFSVPGGDTVQILNTAEALRKKGCHVDISTELEPNVASYDLVHIFNLTRPQDGYLQSLNAKKYRKKIALSTIYMSYIEYDRFARHGIAGIIASMLNPSQVEYFKIMARAVKNYEVNKGTLLILFKGYLSALKGILKAADVLLPNSKSEMERVTSDFPNAANKKFVVVPNAVNINLFDPNKVEVSSNLQEFKGCILSVARIEGRKCQLELVRAAKDLPWPLVLVGKAAPNHVDYFKQIQKEAGSRVHIVGEVPHSVLPQFYKAARVHALVSWMETTGLSSLEAAAMGCNIVITAKGDTSEYFTDRAYYCEPGSIESIRAALIKAYESPGNPQLQDEVRHNFTWEKAAEKTLEGYYLALH